MSTVQQELIRGSLWSFRDQSCLSGVDPCCLFYAILSYPANVVYYCTDQQVAILGQYTVCWRHQQKQAKRSDIRKQECKENWIC